VRLAFVAACSSSISACRDTCQPDPTARAGDRIAGVALLDQGRAAPAAVLQSYMFGQFAFELLAMA